jgi:nucleoside-diphosphate-sugar epimerase
MEWLAHISRKLIELGYTNIITRTRKELDLLNLSKIIDFFILERPEYVFLCAAKVGGIKANVDFPADFIYENLTIQNNIIKCAKDFRVKKLLFLGSSCIYPKMSPQPIKEEYLLSGYLEPTNDAYALAKISGIKTLKELALLIKDIVGFDGNILFDESKPDGTPRKLLDVSKLKELGWIYKTNLREGIEKTYKDYVK